MNTAEICVSLYNHYDSIEQVYNYYGVLAILGLARTAEVTENKELTNRCVKILKNFPDAIKHDDYNFPSYRIGGNARAYAFFKGLIPEDADLLREYADELMNAPRDPKGILKHPKSPDANLIWIDVATAAVPFLLYCGLALEEQKYIDESVKQTVLMYDEFLDSDNNLLHQAKNFSNPGELTQDHWSRGNGWGFFPLAELIQYLPKQSEHRALLEKYFKRHAEALIKYQGKRGLWRQEIPFEYSYEECSGSGLIAYGLGVGLKCGLLEEEIYREPFIKAVHGLYNVCVNKDFSINNSCPGCLCPGAKEGYKPGSLLAYITLCLPYRDEHHGFGPLLLAFSEAIQHGITDL